MGYEADLKLFIDGSWRAGEDRDRFTVVNPVTGGGIAELPLASEADLDEALAAAQRAYPLWRHTDVDKRGAILRKAAQLLRDRTDEIARLLECLDPALQIVLLTARPIRVQRQTLAWLDRYGLRWDLLVMRDWGDYMAAPSFKRLTVHELRDYGFELRLAFEDDQRNVDMFHDEGVPCVYIHSGYHT